MDELWKRALAARGARFDGACAIDFGNAEAERQALSSATTLHPVCDGLLTVEGRDARAFLHTQLTNDVQGLPAARAQYAAYCTPKGRMLATFLLGATADGVWLQLHHRLAEPIAARLRKYVLRSAVQVQDHSDRVALIGVGGPQAASLVEGLVEAVPVEPLALAVRGSLTVCALEAGCFQLMAPADQATQLWDRLVARGAQPSGDPGWRWRRIQAGIPWVTEATQELFVPQMANLDRIGAISFSKGCYPGQEIVARAHYRGEVKRRLFRGHTDGAAAPGQPLFAAGDPSQPAGHVANAAPAPGGGMDLLAVVHVDAAGSGHLRLGAAHGPDVALEPAAVAAAA
jgi:folate-binding protein YgfZ